MQGQRASGMIENAPELWAGDYSDNSPRVIILLYFSFLAVLEFSYG